MPPPSGDYQVFIHLTTPEGGIVQEIEAQPEGTPTSGWRVGEVVVQSYQLPIPPTTISGNYQIRFGFHNPATNVRLPVLEPGRSVQDNFGALILRTVQIVQ